MSSRKKMSSTTSGGSTCPTLSSTLGWWYQVTPPRVPSGRLDHALVMPSEGLFGDGRAPSALMNSRDIGRYVARIIADPRALNKSVFAYTEVLTQQQVYENVERPSGEKLDYNYVSPLTARSPRNQELLMPISADHRRRGR